MVESDFASEAFIELVRELSPDHLHSLFLLVDDWPDELDDRIREIEQYYLKLASYYDNPEVTDADGFYGAAKLIHAALLNKKVLRVALTRKVYG